MALLRHGILDFWRHYWIDLPVNKSLLFQFPQLGGEHFIGNVRNVFLKLTISHNPVFQPPQYGHLPVSSYPIHGEFHRIVIQFVIISKFWHIYLIYSILS